jgi:hypothetical protein
LGILNLLLAGEREESREHATRSHETMQIGRTSGGQSSEPEKNS